MSMTFGEWDEAINAMSKADAGRRLAALETLADWPAFREQFTPTHMFLLRHALQAVIARPAYDNTTVTRNRPNH